MLIFFNSAKFAWREKYFIFDINDQAGLQLIFSAYQNLGSDPKGNLIPAIVGGAALIGAVVNAGSYFASNIKRLGSPDFNLGNSYHMYAIYQKLL